MIQAQAIAARLACARMTMVGRMAAASEAVT